MSELGPLTLGTLSRETAPETPAAAPTRALGRAQVTDRGAALRSVVEEVMALSRQLRRSPEAAEGLSRGEREVLAELGRGGPRTVPQMARSRSVSRQHVQSQVNGLASKGYVEFDANPEHKRSRLVRLSEEGKRRLTEMKETEARNLSPVDVEASVEEISGAAELLRELRDSLRRRDAS